MKPVRRVWPALLAVTFATAVWVAPLSAAEPSDATAVAPAAKADTVKPVTTTTGKRAKVAAKRPRPAPVRIALRSYEPLLGHFLPLFLGVAY